MSDESMYQAEKELFEERVREFICVCVYHEVPRPEIVDIVNKVITESYDEP